MLVVGALLLMLALAGSASAAQRLFPLDGFTQTSGTIGDVWAVTPPDAQGRVIIGGDFDLYGQYNSGGGAVVRTAGEGSVDVTFPAVKGEVRTVVPDGAGGFYIGGQFTCIGVPSGTCTGPGVYARSNLARILADGSVDPTWNPNADSPVLDLEVSGSTVYVAGSFTTVGGQSRNRIAALDTTTGLATAWNPNAANGTSVSDLVVRGTTVYAVGDFTNVGSATRNRIAALDATTGLATAWNPNANGTTYAIKLSADGTRAYVGGAFTNVGGAARNRIAALDTSAGTAVAGWNPDASAAVVALAVDGTTVYAGGVFATIGGQTRSRIAALDATTGNATSWDPKANDTVRGITVSGGTVYLGGDFTCIGAASLPCAAAGGQVRRYAGAVDAASGAPTAWNPRTTNTVYQFAPVAGSVYLAGNYTHIGGTPVANLARIDVDGNLIPFPQVDDTVLSVTVANEIAYVGGNFACVDGQVVSGTCTGTARNRIAAIATNGDGSLTSWNPNASGGSIWALAVVDSVVYAGGGFTAIGGQTRSRIAALDASTGSASAWNPSSNSVVYTLGVSGSTVYAGGAFTSIGGQPRNYLAALDTATGAATSWNPNLNQAVYALIVDGSTVYAGGGFGCVNGNAVCTGAGTGTVRSAAAAFDATGTATAWNPNVDMSAYDGVRAMALGAGGIFLAGNFVTLNGGAAPRTNVALVDRTTGTAASWTATVDRVPSSPASATLYAIAASPGAVFVGGRFESISGTGRVSFGAISSTSGSVITSWPRPATPTGVTATAGDASATVSWTASARATGYTVTASPGGATCTTTTTSCVVTGLANGTAYTFTVVANGTYGESDPSASSTSVTPVAAPAAAPAAAVTPAKAKKPKAGRAALPASLVRAGLYADAEGTVPLTIACSRGTASCRASGTLTGPDGTVLGRFGSMRIAAGAKRAVAIRLAAAPYASVRASGAARVRVTLRTVNRLANGTSRTVTQRVWLRVAPQAPPEPVTG